VKRTKKANTKAAAPKAPRRTKMQAQEALGAALARVVRARAMAPMAAAPPTRMVVTVEVDGSHLIPYSVRWDGDRVLDQLQSDQAAIMMSPGRHLLTWSFNHTIEATWRHKLTVQIDGQAPRVLADKNSTANPKDAVSGGTEIFVA